MRLHVDIWADVICPWCYLGKRRFERAVASLGSGKPVDVTYRAFELDPSAPRGSTVPVLEMLQAKYGMSAGQAEAAQAQMEERASLDGLAFNMKGVVSGNTRDAHRLSQLAKQRGLQEELVERLYSAYFTEQALVFDQGTLARLGVEVGLASDEVAAVLAGDAYDSEVEADRQAARALGVTGVPFFALDNRYAISGAQPTEVFARALQQVWAGSGS